MSQSQRAAFQYSCMLKAIPLRRENSDESEYDHNAPHCTAFQYSCMLNAIPLRRENSDERKHDHNAPHYAAFACSNMHAKRHASAARK